MKPTVQVQTRTACRARSRSAAASNSATSPSPIPAPIARVLKNFNFWSSQPGERIALIGENGQGKTTVVKLITRLYDPTEGQILLDGIDLREYASKTCTARSASSSRTSCATR
jgi:ABC-type transport system involved in cytochrome bd biosynthesis fused ATPase/permease subunit